MYNENSFLNYITGLKIRRIFFMIIFSIIGAIIGIFLSDFIINVLLFESWFRIVIIAISTLIFFAISLILTINTTRDIQEGYWKIALLRKLTVISKKLDALENVSPEARNEFLSEVKSVLEESMYDDTNSNDE